MTAHIDDAYYVNFADCSPIAGRCGAREFLFGKRTGSKELMSFAAQDYLRSEDPLTSDEHNLFYRLQTVFTHKEMTSFGITPIVHRDFWYESVGIFIARDEQLYLAVKAGDNDDSHNHNDTGSFTVYKNGKPMFIDVGVETYTKKTFSKDRYEIWAMQSCYHNLPTFFDGQTQIMQEAGADFRAKNVAHRLGASDCRIFMDLTSAYPDKRIRSYTRNAVLKKGKGIIISDYYEGDLPNPVLSLMFYEEPVVNGDTVKVGDLGSFLIYGASKIQKEVIPITDERLKITWKHDVYRLLVTMDKNELILTI